MLSKLTRCFCAWIISFAIICNAFGDECVSDELKDRLKAVINDAHEIFTSGRYLEANVLGRQVLRVPNAFVLGKPTSVHSTVSETIQERIKKGETNLDLMRSGTAPIGPDGKHMNLHHLFAEEPGPMAEMTQTEHLKDHRKAIHVMVKNSFRNDKKKERDFDKFKEDYWRARAAELQSP